MPGYFWTWYGPNAGNTNKCALRKKSKFEYFGFRIIIDDYPKLAGNEKKKRARVLESMAQPKFGTTFN